MLTTQFQNIYYLKLLVLSIIIKKLFELPVTRYVSQTTGYVMNLYIPKILRIPIFTIFSEIYKVRRQDMIHPLQNYETFNKFFTRQIKPRKIECGIISPADSKILSISKITKNECLLVKRVTYQIGQFLTGIKGYEMEFKKRQESSNLWSCIFYLAPGDYHRYHCPVDFIARTRLHIPGKLAPVKESSLKQGLYEGNERVVLEGEWEQGLMYIIFIGATNVGSMKVNFDSDLITNTNTYHKNGYRNYSKLSVNSPYSSCDKGVHIKKGQEIGRFEMGSTVVMIFESTSIEWNAKLQQKVYFGQQVASY
ncbi:unnamed protein product [Paramecium sonneborni]|uniref:phosphatidylserine decarboxylase n=1 Tax=Paramecium sonneborni TaxID=65129 RepID=A0A8S1Q1X1_9CILI|nr:unnamed protein product [Paramecium sonneborni]